MIQYNENLSEALVLLGTLPSGAQTAGAKTVGPFTCRNLSRVLFLIDIGTLGASATVDFKIQASSTSGGTYADVPGTTITQITAGASNFVEVELKTETLAQTGTGVGPWIKGILTIGVATTQASVIALGTAKTSPGSDGNLVTPAQVLVA